MARDHGCTPGQLALAWLLRQGEHVIPIPGTTRLAHLEENLGAAGVRLDAAACDALARLFGRDRVAGERYGPATQAEVDTEQFPAS
jgi:aryl-alcohol dehydrogenase-like predicted oxidoreductase